MKKIVSKLTYNYELQLLLKYSLAFFFREIFWKFKNFFFKKRFKLKFNKNNYLGWSTVVLTTKLDKNIYNNIKSYKNKFNKKNNEIIIIADKSDINISDKKIKLINLNSSRYTLGFKRNLGISHCNYKNIFMTLDYTRLKKINIKGLNIEIKSFDLLVPRLITLDNKRYLDWMFIDFPKIGKSFAPYNFNRTNYMYFHGTCYIFKKKFILKNLFSEFLDNKQGEDVSWSLRIRNNCFAKASKNIIIQVQRKANENKAITNGFFKENNKRLKYYLLKKDLVSMK